MTKSCVLLAEDNLDLLDLYSVVLQHAGFEVRRAEDGEQALRELQQRKPDVLVTDVMMPGLTGLDLIDWVRRDRALRDLPVVVLSAHKDYLAQAAAHGATRVIDKPVEAFSLVSTILDLMPDTTVH